MSMHPSVRLSIGLVSLVLALLCCGCAGEGMAVQTADCWGSGEGDCREAQGRVLRALGYKDAGLAAVGADLTCGAVVDCAALAEVVAKSPAVKTSQASPVKPTSTGNPAATTTVPAGSGSPASPVAVQTEGAQQDAVAAAAEPSTGTAAAEEQAPAAPSEKVAAVSGPTGSCKGIDIGALDNKGSLSDAEKTCLMDAARGKAEASDPDIQVAVIVLFNQKVPGWQKAVEAALSRKNLANAPNLNFAGIKPAYDGAKYATVIKRSDVVWRNLKKGYALSGEQRTFLSEFACRSALQLHLMQKPNDRGFDWCERWRSRLSKSGGSTAEVDDILDQLED